MSSQENRYTMDKILGEGGSGIVFLGTDQDNNAVVVKQFKNSILDVQSQSWKREIETLKQINHPQIPRYLDYFEKVIEKRRLPHLVMEYKEGQNVKEYLQDNRLNFHQSIEILQQILLLLSYIHSFQPPLIHRDIKPSNLLIQSDGSLILIDFGIAVDDIHKTVGRTLGVGTLGYQAPEQIIGDPTIRSDLYSLGVIAIEMFTRISPKELLNHNGMLDWQQKCLDLPISWQRWLDRMLMEDPKSRFSSAEDAIKNMPEVNLQDIQDSIRREKTRAAVHLPELKTTNNFLKALQEKTKEHRAEKIAEREKERRAKDKKLQKIKERKIKESRRLAKERQKKDALLAYTQKIDVEIMTSWDALIAVIARDEIPPQRGLSLFVDQFTEELRFTYETEVFQIESIEYELAKMFPLVNLDIINQYKMKMKQRITDRLECSELYQDLNQELALLQELLSDIEFQVDSNEDKLDNIAFWERWIGQDDDIEEDIDELQQIQRKHIKRAREIKEEKSKMLEQHLQPYLLEWTEIEEVEIHSPGIHFFVMKTQVTQKLWELITQETPSRRKGDNRPVERVNWLDCIVFANQLSEKLGFEKVYDHPKDLTFGMKMSPKKAQTMAESIQVKEMANGYRLPTLKEWKFAATARQNFKYPGSNDLDKVAWYGGYEYKSKIKKWKKIDDGNSSGRTHDVGQKKPNGFGLYDMSGNVWEWCWDTYKKTDKRYALGGSFENRSTYCRLAYSNYSNYPHKRISSGGVRFFRTSKNQATSITVEFIDSDKDKITFTFNNTSLQIDYFVNDQLKVKSLSLCSVKNSTIQIDGTSAGSWSSQRKTTAPTKEKAQSVLEMFLWFT